MPLATSYAPDTWTGNAAATEFTTSLYFWDLEDLRVYVGDAEKEEGVDFTAAWVGGEAPVSESKQLILTFNAPPADGAVVFAEYVGLPDYDPAATFSPDRFYPYVGRRTTERIAQAAVSATEKAERALSHADPHHPQNNPTGLVSDAEITFDNGAAGTGFTDKAPSVRATSAALWDKVDKTTFDAARTNDATAIANLTQALAGVTRQSADAATAAADAATAAQNAATAAAAAQGTADNAVASAATNATAIAALQAGAGAGSNPRWTQAQTDLFAAIREIHEDGAVVFTTPYDGIFKVSSGSARTANAIAAGTLAEGTAANGPVDGLPNTLIITPLNEIHKVLVLENLKGNDSNLISLRVMNSRGQIIDLPFFERGVDADGKTRYFFRNLDGAQNDANTNTGIEAKNGDSLAISMTAASGDPTAESFVVSLRRAGEAQHAQNTITAPAGTLARARFNQILVPDDGNGNFRSWSDVAVIHHSGVYVSHAVLGHINLADPGDYYGIAVAGPGSDKLQITKPVDYVAGLFVGGQDITTLIAAGGGGGGGISREDADARYWLRTDQNIPQNAITGLVDALNGKLSAPAGFVENDILVQGAAGLTRRPIPIVAREGTLIDFADTPVAPNGWNIAVGHNANIEQGTAINGGANDKRYVVRIGRTPLFTDRGVASAASPIGGDAFSSVAIGDVCGCAPTAIQSVMIGDGSRGSERGDVSLGVRMNSAHLTTFPFGTARGVYHTFTDIAAADFLENTGGNTRGRFAPSYYDDGTFLTAPNGVWIKKAGAWVEFSSGGSGGGATTLRALTDTPAAYGTAGQILAMNAARTALEWVDAPSGGGGGGGGVAISDRIDVAGNVAADQSGVPSGSTKYDFDLTNAVLLFARNNFSSVGSRTSGAIAAQRNSDGEWVEIVNDANNFLAVRDDGITVANGSTSFSNFYALISTGGSGEMADDPNLHAAWFGDGDPRDGKPYSSPAAVINRGGVEIAGTDSDVLFVDGEKGVTLRRASTANGQGTYSVEWDGDIDYNAIGFRAKLTLSRLGQQPGFYFGADNPPSGGVPVAQTNGGLLIYIEPAAGTTNNLRIINLATGGWLQSDTFEFDASGFGSHPNQSIPAVAVGDHDFEAYYYQGRLRVVIDGNQVFDEYIQGALPKLDGTHFGFWAELATGDVGNATGANNQIKLNRVEVADPQGDDIEIFRAASGGSALPAYTAADKNKLLALNAAGDALLWKALSATDIGEGTLSNERIGDDSLGESKFTAAVRAKLAATLPAGGTAGQILAKKTATANDVEWIDAPSGGSGGLPAGFVSHAAQSAIEATISDTGTISLQANWNNLTAAQQNAHNLLLRIDDDGAEGDYTSTPPLSVLMQGVANSNSRIIGFRVPAHSNVAGLRLTITRGATGKITGIVSAGKSGGSLARLIFIRPPGLYHEG